SQQHLSRVEELVAQVQSTVSAFEADMDTFFERLLAENDPARLATLAEQAPDPPDLTGLPDHTWQDVTFSAGTDDTSTDAVTEDLAEDAVGPADGAGATADADGEAVTGALEANAAAEAEAAATEGLDMAGADQWPGAVMSAARREESATTDTGATDAAHSRLLVSGLTSVAGISAFKGAVGQLPGVRSVSVSSGERGVFIFTVNHEPDADIAEAVAGLSGFAVRITEASGDSLSVTAHEPAA
ncbi:MAG: heavy-metal-associated domain-containing protein, partial [Chloroflexi bacterium]|nr:heavy-metal-associated domain-containing protein [Chloroflexota bacterium]